MPSVQHNSTEIQAIEYEVCFKDRPYLHTNNSNISVAESIPESAFGKAFTTFKPCPKCQNDTAILHKFQHFHGAEFRCEECDHTLGSLSKEDYRNNPIACIDTIQPPKRSPSPLRELLSSLGKSSSREFILTNPCPKCSHNRGILKPHSVHEQGVYCQSCDRWIAWVGKSLSKCKAIKTNMGDVSLFDLGGLNHG